MRKAHDLHPSGYHDLHPSGYHDPKFVYVKQGIQEEKRYYVQKTNAQPCCARKGYSEAFIFVFA